MNISALSLTTFHSSTNSKDVIANYLVKYLVNHKFYKKLEESNPWKKILSYVLGIQTN